MAMAKDNKYLTEYRLWATDPYFIAYHAELAAIADDPAEIRERFYKEPDFGTAGIRGVMEAGLNRINIPLVRKVSTAIARYVNSMGSARAKQGIVIGYDSRNNSLEFAREAAAVFAGHGIRTYIHKAISPVPLLSYSVRTLGTAMGVMITASHNPKQYNSYKVYGPDGAQLSPEDSVEISRRMSRIADFRKLRPYDFDALIAGGNIEYCPDSVVDNFFKTVRALLSENVAEHSGTAGLKVVYTALHGAGARFVPEILKEIGVGRVYPVKSQMAPDGNFPTVPVPNPESPDAYRKALAIARRTGADLIIATDPDSDRTGACVRNRHGEYELLTGNEIGEILLLRRIELNKKPRPFAVSTLVSTRLAEKICSGKGIKYVDVLTGFKFIGEQIKLLEEQGDGHFIFGFEESYGFLAGSYCRDKDAVASCMLLCEAAAFYKQRGLTLIDALEEIYSEFGAQHEIQTSLQLEGESGAVEMQCLLTAVRALGPDILPGDRPVYYMDLLNNKRWKRTSKGGYRVYEEKEFPISDVLYYSYVDFWFCLRPSGTEPKIKIYFGCNGASRTEAASNAEELKNRVMAQIRAL